MVEVEDPLLFAPWNQLLEVVVDVITAQAWTDIDVPVPVDAADLQVPFRHFAFGLHCTFGGERGHFDRAGSAVAKREVPIDHCGLAASVVVLDGDAEGAGDDGVREQLFRSWWVSGLGDH